MAASTELHESPESLSTETINFHRAIVSLQEELEAVDWYRQRAQACDDPELRDILLHNMREEMEHAAMVLEWMRRHDADLDQRLRTYLFTTGRVTEIEEEEEEQDGPGDAQNEAPSAPRMTVGTMKGES